MSNPACIEDCATHPDRLCERDPGHDGDHECYDCPGQRKQRRQQAIADRIAAHRVAELVETTPDDD
jgi:hypothetical protein